MSEMEEQDQDEILNEQETDLFEHYRVKVDQGQEPLRIDKFLVDRLPKVSRNRVQLAAKAGSILVNGKEVKPNYKVKPGDEVTLVLAEPPREFELIPENIPLDIVFEDNHLVVLNKPAGLVVHPGLGNYSGTLVNALTYHFQNLPDNDPLTRRPGLVHRLDKNTSGLMVIAKDESTMTGLAKQFFDRTIDRSYQALVWGDVEPKEGEVEGNIGRSLRNRQVMTVFSDEDLGKYSLTQYKTIERFGYVTLVECRLKTGRTHQIRVHMQHIGYPVFNDDTYGGNQIVKGTVYTKYKQFVENCFKIMPRQALHAKSLGFVHPVTKEKLSFVSELPEEMMQVLEKWRVYTNAINLRG